MFLFFLESVDDYTTRKIKVHKTHVFNPKLIFKLYSRLLRKSLKTNKPYAISYKSNI